MYDRQQKEGLEVEKKEQEVKSQIQLQIIGDDQSIPHMCVHLFICMHLYVCTHYIWREREQKEAMGKKDEDIGYT